MRSFFSGLRSSRSSPIPKKARPTAMFALRIRAQLKTRMSRTSALTVTLGRRPLLPILQELTA